MKWNEALMKCLRSGSGSAVAAGALGLAGLSAVLIWVLLVGLGERSSWPLQLQLALTPAAAEIIYEADFQRIEFRAGDPSAASETMAGVWYGVDPRLKDPEGSGDDHPPGAHVRLRRQAYVAPHLHHALPRYLHLPETYVVHLPVKAGTFMGKAGVVAMLETSTGSIAVAVRQNGSIGVTPHLFARPVFSRPGVVQPDRWQAIYIVVLSAGQQIELYVDGRLVLREQWPGLLRGAAAATS